jgi:hypothetical protein
MSAHAFDKFPSGAFRVMKKDISAELQICPTFKVTPELELDRRLLGWSQRGVTMEGNLLCRALCCSERQYWEAVARLHYLGLIKFRWLSDKPSSAPDLDPTV